MASRYRLYCVPMYMCLSAMKKYLSEIDVTCSE